MPTLGSEIQHQETITHSQTPKRQAQRHVPELATSRPHHQQLHAFWVTSWAPEYLTFLTHPHHKAYFATFGQRHALPRNPPSSATTCQHTPSSPCIQDLPSAPTSGTHVMPARSCDVIGSKFRSHRSGMTSRTSRLRLHVSIARVIDEPSF